jgi:glutaredoxin 3
MKKRKVEVFTAGCEVCEDVVRAVRAAACDSCDVEVRSMHEKAHADAARGYGINRLPAVVIDGKLADCCEMGGVDMDRLRSLGLGQPA